MAQLITLYRGTDAPDVIFEIAGSDLNGSDIEMEVRWRRVGGPLNTLTFSTADSEIELLDPSHIRWRPTSQVSEAMPDNGAVGDFFRRIDGRREKIGAFTVQVLGPGEYDGTVQLVVLGPVLQGPPGWTPILAMVEAGARTVMQVADWIGGNGEKPAAPVYIGASGLVATPAEASDLKALALAQAQAAASTATSAASAAAGSATTATTKAGEATDAATIAVQAAGTSTAGAGISTTKADAAAASATQANGFAAGAASVAWAAADLRAKGLTVMPRLIIDTEIQAYHLRDIAGPILTSGDFSSFIATA